MVALPRPAEVGVKPLPAVVGKHRRVRDEDVLALAVRAPNSIGFKGGKKVVKIRRTSFGIRLDAADQ